MSEIPTREAYAACVHTRFHVMEDKTAGINLELVEVSELKTFARQEVFSLILEGPAECFLPQKIYRLEHPQLGEADLFLVPTGRNANAFLYEVVFNQLLPSE